MANKGRMKREFAKIAFALESDEITPEQRYALVASRNTLKWFASFTQKVQHPSPTELILPGFFDADPIETE